MNSLIESDVQLASHEVIPPIPMLTTTEYNKRVTSRNLGLKPGLLCANCKKSEILIENPSIVTKDMNGPRYMVAKCPSCKHVCKIYTRN